MQLQIFATIDIAYIDKWIWIASVIEWVCCPVILKGLWRKKIRATVSVKGMYILGNKSVGDVHPLKHTQTHIENTF